MSHTAEKSPAKSTHAIWLGLICLLVIAALGKPLFSPDQVLSDRGTDVASQFLYARAFGFGEILKGNLPFWNPYIYGGVPFLGDFQAALLYPLNVIFLILPLSLAISWSFALHTMLLGIGAYFWAFGRGLKPFAAFVTGACAMLGGTFFLHIYAGHLSNVCTMAWVPWLFLGIDRWLKRRHAGWLILAAAAVALQIFAGHPQYVYYTALVAGLYSIIHLVGLKTQPRTAALGLLAIYPVAALIAAPQLLPGLNAAAESARSGGVTYEFASMFSFPPENLATLISPWIFGGTNNAPYWGRCYLWEMCVYAGLGMLVLAFFGASEFSREKKSERLRLLILLALAFILALGAHTPVHSLLYHILPGFGGFRGASKFIFFAALVLALFAGMGVDRLLRGGLPRRSLTVSAMAAGVVLLAAGFIVTAGQFQSLAIMASDSTESYLNPAALSLPEIVQNVHRLGTFSLKFAGAALLIFGLALETAKRWKPMVWFIGAAAILEVFLFARQSTASFPLSDFTFESVADFYRKNPGDYRSLNLFNPDASMILNNENVWGYDPTVLKRYAQLLFVSQGADPEEAGQYLPFKTAHPILSLLRARIALVPKQDGGIDVSQLGEPFPRFFNVSQYTVLKDRPAIFEELRRPGLDFKNTVILENEPIPAPDKDAAKVEFRVVDSSTDHWTLEIANDKATLLVMTDAYSKDWKVTALPGSVQTTYNLMPANLAIRAIPLAAGRHNLRLEYRPTGFRLGLLLSLFTLAALAAALVARPLRPHLNFSND